MLKARVVAIFLAVVCLLTLVACSEDASSATTGTTASTTSTTAATERSTQPATAGNQKETMEEILNTTQDPWSGNQNDAAFEGDMPYSLPLSDDTLEISIWGSTPAADSGMIDLNDSVAWQEVSKRLNVKIDWHHPTIGQESVQFNLMIASQQLTDLINGTSYYIGGFDKYIDQGSIRDLTELVPEYCKNYMLRRTVDDECMRQSITDSNRIAAVWNINPYWQPCWIGPCARTDWMEEWGYTSEDLETYDGWYSFLSKAKESGVESPYTVSATTGLDPDLTNGYNIGAWPTGGRNGWYQLDGTVYYGGYVDEFRDYLEMFSKWYAEGLIDQDFYSRTSADRESLALNSKAAIARIGFNNLDRYDAQTVDSGTWTPIEIPTPEKDTVRYYHSGNTSQRCKDCCTTVSTSCDESKLPMIMKFLDYFFTQEGRILSNYGVEGVSFYYADDGQPVLYDEILNNPDGISATAMIQKYCIYQTGIANMFDYRREFSSTMSEKARTECGIIWDTDVEGINKLYAVDIAPEYATEYTSKFSDCDTYMQEWSLSVMTGLVELNDETWNEYIAELENLGIKECIEWYQQAWDNYLNRDVTVGYN